jgi:hypothetical protein
MWGSFIAASRLYRQNLPKQMSIAPTYGPSAGTMLEALEEHKAAPLSQKQPMRPWEPSK